MTKKSSASAGRGTQIASSENERTSLVSSSRSDARLRYAAEAQESAEKDNGKWLPGLPSDHLEILEKSLRGELSAEDFAELGGFSPDPSPRRMSLDIAETSAPEAIIFPDDRIRILDTFQSPYHKICHLTFRSRNGTSLVATGWLAGKKLVVTAGHCIYNRDPKYGVGWVSDINVYPARNGLKRPGSAAAADVRTVTAWEIEGNEEFDIGCIFLDKPLGDEFGWFSYYAASNGELNGLKASIAGFPGDKASGTMWAHANKVTQVAANRLTYLIDTMGGQSGSPVIAWDDQTSDWLAIGIHNYGITNQANYATRINNDVYQVIESWQRQSELA